MKNVKTNLIAKNILALSLLIPFSVSVGAADYTKEIEQRQDAFKIIKDNVEMTGDMFESGELKWDKLQMYSKALAEASAPLKDLFPKGSQEGSNSKAAVWKNSDKFMMGIDKLSTSFAAMEMAAGKEDKMALMQGFKDATDTCKACHRKFRVKK